MRVREIMAKDPLCARADDTLLDAVRHMEERKVRHLPVVEAGRLIGVLSDRDLLEATGARPQGFVDGEDRRPKLVRDYMSAHVETTSPDEGAADAALYLARRSLGCLPVVEGGKLVGIVTETDVMAAYAEACRVGFAPDRTNPPASDCMTAAPATIGPEATVAAAFARSRELDVRHLPVLHDGWFVGIVSDRDLRLWVGRGRADEVTVGEAMSKVVVSAAPNARLAECCGLMLGHRFSAVPVVNQGRLEGIVTSVDVLEHYAQLAVRSRTR